MSVLYAKPSTTVLKNAETTNQLQQSPIPQSTQKDTQSFISKSFNTYQKKIINELFENDNQYTSWPATSTNIYIKIGDKIIGLIQSLSVSMDRDIASVYEIGSELAVSLVPQRCEGGTIECEKMAIVKTNFLELIKMNNEYISGITPISATRQSIIEQKGYSNFIGNLYQQRIPFDIEVVENYPSDPSNDSPEVNKTLTTIYKFCWIANFSKEYAADTIHILERVTIRFLLSIGIDSDIPQPNTNTNIFSNLGLRF